MKQYFGLIHPKPLTNLVKHLQGMIKGRLWLKILVAMVLGLAVGMLLTPQAALLERDTAEIVGSWLAIPGNVFLGLIQMIVIPLIFASIIRGLASSEDLDQLKKVGIRIAVYFLITTILAVIIGLSISSIIGPGHYIDAELTSAVGIAVDEPAPDVVAGNNNSENGMAGTYEATDGDAGAGIGSLPEIFVSLIPENPLGSMVKREMLQVVLFAIIIGLAPQYRPGRPNRSSALWVHCRRSA